MTHSIEKNNAIIYPFNDIPESGQFLPVAEGVYWLRMPLPFALNHINLWLIEGEKGYTLVDSGWASDKSIEVWKHVEQALFKDKPVEKIVVTHMHPDHVGLAGWLAKTHNVELWMSRSEYLSCHLLLAYTHQEAPSDAVDFYRAAGFNDEQLDHYRANFGKFGQYIRALPHAYHRLVDGDKLEIGDSEWQVVMGSGHSPEHACLYSAEHKLFISGDQLLPTISSNVSVWPTEPHANPMQEWLDSCQKLVDFIPEDTLILPSHGEPFYGADFRLNSLITQHEKDLAKLLDFCAEPRTAVETFSLLFHSEINDNNRLMAVGESMACLVCLAERGLLNVTLNEGVKYWQRV